MHIYMSKDYKNEMIGNFLGDFIKGNITSAIDIDSEIKRGLILHRRIDSFSEKNIHFKTSKNRFPKHLQRFSPIAIDIIYDHFLAKNFNNITKERLDLFLEDFYIHLNNKKFPISQEKQKIIQKIIKENWMYNYQNKEFTKNCILRISKRRKRLYKLSECCIWFEEEYENLEKDFFKFLPELTKFVIHTRKNLV